MTYVINKTNLLPMISDLVNIIIRSKKKRSLILYIVCLLHRQKQPITTRHTPVSDSVLVFALFFFSVLQSTIILSEFKHNVTLTGQNASLIHCARLIYLQPTPPLNNCAKPTHSLTKEGQLKIQNGFRPNIHLHKSKSLFSKYPLRKLNTCSSGYKTKKG